jgi:hypothetical protein
VPLQTTAIKQQNASTGYQAACAFLAKDNGNPAKTLYEGRSNGVANRIAPILKVRPIPLRRHPELTNESTPQTVHRDKAASFCDSLGGKVGILDLTPGLVEADSLHILVRRLSKLINKQAPKITLAHPDAG